MADSQIAYNRKQSTDIRRLLCVTSKHSCTAHIGISFESSYLLSSLSLSLFRARALIDIMIGPVVQAAHRALILPLDTLLLIPLAGKL